MDTNGHETLRRMVLDSKSQRAALPNAAVLGETFAKLFEERLRAVLKLPVSVAFEENILEKYVEIVNGQEENALFAAARLRGGAFGGIAPMEPGLAFRLVEILSGAERKPGPPPSRSLTAIDEALCEDFAAHMINCFEGATAPSARPECRGALRFDRFVRDIAGLVEEPEQLEMLTLRLSMKLGPEEEPDIIWFSTPLGVFDYYRAEADVASQEPPRRSDTGETSPETLWARAMIRAANIAEYRLVAVLADLTLDLSDLEEMAPGTIIPLGEGSERMGVAFRVEKIGGVAREPTLCTGSLGAAGERRAVRMIEGPDDQFLRRHRPFVVEEDVS